MLLTHVCQQACVGGEVVAARGAQVPDVLDQVRVILVAMSLEEKKLYKPPYDVKYTETFKGRV